MEFNESKKEFEKQLNENNKIKEKSFGKNVDVNKEEDFFKNNVNKGEKFSVKFPAESFDFSSLEAKLYKMEKRVNEYIWNKIGNCLDQVKGGLIQSVDENGRGYYEYTGTLSALGSKSDIEKIRQMLVIVIDVIIQHSGYNVLVEFNDCSVIVEDRGKYREKERTLEVENVPKHKYAETLKYINPDVNKGIDEGSSKGYGRRREDRDMGLDI